MIHSFESPGTKIIFILETIFKIIADSGFFVEQLLHC